MAPKVQDLFSRFSKFVDTDTNSGCWEWVGFKQDKGYGQIKIKGRMVYAHRFSYEMFHGPIPEDIMITHKCNNRSCVNPDHLYAGTAATNMQDCLHAGTHNWTKLTANEVRGIRGAMKYTNLSSHVLANLFGVHKDTIEHCVRGRTYAWVD